MTTEEIYHSNQTQDEERLMEPQTRPFNTSLITNLLTYLFG